MFIDNNGKLFGKINIIDVFILLIILLAAAVLSFKFFGTNSNTATNSQKEYVVLIENIKPDALKFISEDDIFYDDDGAYMGKVLSVTAEPSLEVKENFLGEFVTLNDENRKNIKITFVCTGSQTNDGFYIDGKVSLMLGTTRFFKGQKIDFEGKIIEIK